jgi:hypothetical protein
LINDVGEAWQKNDILRDKKLCQIKEEVLTTMVWVKIADLKNWKPEYVLKHLVKFDELVAMSKVRYEYVLKRNTYHAAALTWGFISGVEVNQENFALPNPGFTFSTRGDAWVRDNVLFINASGGIGLSGLPSPPRVIFTAKATLMRGNSVIAKRNFARHDGPHGSFRQYREYFIGEVSFTLPRAYPGGDLKVIIEGMPPVAEFVDGSAAPMNPKTTKAEIVLSVQKVQ